MAREVALKPTQWALQGKIANLGQINLYSGPSSITDLFNQEPETNLVRAPVSNQPDNICELEHAIKSV